MSVNSSVVTSVPPYPSHSLQMKQDASHESGGASSGSAKAGGGSAAGGGGRWDELAREEVVERSKQDPFVEVTETVAGPMRLERGSGRVCCWLLSLKGIFIEGRVRERERGYRHA